TSRALISFAKKLAVHPRADSEEIRDSLAILLQYDNEPTAVEFVVEQTIGNSLLYLNHRRDLAAAMAAVGELSAAKTVWRKMLEWQEYASNEEVELIDAILHAHAGEW